MRTLIAVIALTLSQAAVGADQSTAAEKPQLRGVIEVDLDDVAQEYIFVLSNGDIKAIPALDCRTMTGCKALVKELEAADAVAHIELKQKQAT